MDLFGIGPLEFLFLIIIILLIAGPRDIARGARGLGRALNRLYRSANYQMIQRVSQEIRNLPARLAEEAQLEELKEVAQLKELKEAEAEVKEAARGISELNRQEMRAWVDDPDAPTIRPPTAKGSASAPSPTPTATAPSNTPSSRAVNGSEPSRSNLPADTDTPASSPSTLPAEEEAAANSERAAASNPKAVEPANEQEASE